MFGPMYDPPPSLLDQPAVWLVAAVAGTLWLLGWRWLRAITGGDAEPDSFWATARRGARLNAFLLAGLVLAAIAVALVVLAGA